METNSADDGKVKSVQCQSIKMLNLLVLVWSFLFCQLAIWYLENIDGEAADAQPPKHWASAGNRPSRSRSWEMRMKSATVVRRGTKSEAKVRLEDESRQQTAHFIMTHLAPKAAASVHPMHAS